MGEWKLVPVEPTALMLTALWNLKDAASPADLKEAYAAMLAAAPQAPSGQQAEPTDEQTPLDAAIQHCEAHGINLDFEVLDGIVTAALAGQQSERPAPAKSKCALCGDPARIPPTCDACHDSMGTRPAPAGQAVGDISMEAWVRLSTLEQHRLLELGVRHPLAASQAERPAVKEGDRA